MPKTYVTILGKAIRAAAKLRGGGSALPGLIVERIDPKFIKHALSSLPLGVVVVSGTNGKTTTTKMVVKLLEDQGLKVFTNRTGSNFTRGVVAALLGEVNLRGELKADIAVLELDEAHAVHFVEVVPPRYSLILNVMRDQLDRFGEIDMTTNLLGKIVSSTKKAVVLNREDRRVAGLKDLVTDQKVNFFGLGKNILDNFPSDDTLYGGKQTNDNITADVELDEFTDGSATFKIDGKNFKTELKLNGMYNVYNSAAAISLVRSILDDKTDTKKIIHSLSSVKPAFGRGESISINGATLELILVKNPSGFRLGLKSFDPASRDTMIAINDNYADGRDMSWLWDVDFTTLKSGSVSCVSGVRAYDMALRLQYDEVSVGTIDTDLISSLNQFVISSSGKAKRIYCTYTAMLAIRKRLSKLAEIEVIG